MKQLILGKTWQGILTRIACVGIFLICFIWPNWKLVQVRGESMEPTLYGSDVCILYKKAYSATLPQQNDVIVLVHNSDRLVKRVIGLPGDTIQLIDGDIYINDKELADEYSHNKVSLMLVDIEGNYLRDWEFNEKVHEYTNLTFKKLGENQYWVIGDNRSISWFGIVDGRNIRGKLAFIE